MGISQWKNFFIYQPWSHGIGLGSLNGGLSSPGGHLGGLGARTATAALGSAQTVGKLSVPPSWAGATPAIRLAATSLPDGAFAATAAPTMEVPLSALNQASLGSLAGGALGSPASRVVTSTGVRAKVTTPARVEGTGPTRQSHREAAGVPRTRCSTGTSTRPVSTTWLPSCLPSPASTPYI